jgi:hypothetical protein
VSAPPASPLALTFHSGNNESGEGIAVAAAWLWKMRMPRDFFKLLPGASSNVLSACSFHPGIVDGEDHPFPLFQGASV